MVLARTRAEVRALSHLMRERRFAALTDGERADTDRVTVIVSRGSEDDRATSPLEIVRGDRMRIGATHWEKQLFSGTVVTVEDFKVERGEAGTEPSVLISGHTEDGRKVSFHHDEIRDWYGNIRLDHGYALTITSAQGLTVDRTFLLADARPARETIYPAATRHREGLDIYVNRAPLFLDIADRRADKDREIAVTDTQIRAYLAERWSRSQPKEAALDYMDNGIWEDRRENVREDRSRSSGETQGEAGDIPAAANDNALARIARDIRRTAFGWRHAQTVTSFVDGRRQVLAAYDELRERTRAEGHSVALTGTFRETLTRHAGLLKQAAAFRARPDDFASLLAQRGGIGRKELDAFEELHARARRHRRAATMRHVHQIKREAEQQGVEPEKRQEALVLEGGPADAAERTETVERNAIAAPSQAHAGVAPPVAQAEPAKPDWYAPYMALRQDWNSLIEDARQAGILSFYAKGYVDMMPRIRAIAENLAVPAKARAPMIQVLENHQRYLSIRKHIEDYLDKTDRHMDARTSLWREAEGREIDVTEVPDYPGWRQEAGRLTAAGEAILSDKKTYGPHVDNITIGESRVTWALSNISRAIGGDDEAIGEQTAEVQKPPVPPETPEERALRAQKDAKSSAGFSRPRTTQQGKRARQRRRPSTTISNAKPISTKRPAKSGAMPSTLIPPSSAAATTFPKIRNRHKNSPPPRKRLRSAPARPRRTPASSAGFSRPHTTQRGKRARRRRRPSTTISNARPISTTRPE